MTLSPLHLYLVCGERIHLIGSMTLSLSPVAVSPLHLYLVCGERIHLMALWLSLLSTCSCLSSPPVSGVWWAHTLDWLYDSLSSPPVAGVWWAHTLDCLYDSLSSPPVSGVWWAHTLDWFYDSLSSPPVSGESIHLIGSMTLSPLSTCIWCVVNAYTWLSLWLSLLSTCSCLSSPPVSGVWWAHTLDWLYDSLSSPPVAVSPLHLYLCGERIHLIGSMTLSPLHL